MPHIMNNGRPCQKQLLLKGALGQGPKGSIKLCRGGSKSHQVISHYWTEKLGRTYASGICICFLFLWQQNSWSISKAQAITKAFPLHAFSGNRGINCVKLCRAAANPESGDESKENMYWTAIIPHNNPTQFCAGYVVHFESKVPLSKIWLSFHQHKIITQHSGALKISLRVMLHFPRRAPITR